MREANYQRKPITAFEPGDTLYIQKTEGDFKMAYLCRFEAYQRGTVKAEVIAPANTKRMGKAYKLSAGDPISARLKNCYLWGFDRHHVMGSHRVIWFKHKDCPAGATPDDDSGIDQVVESKVGGKAEA